MALEGQVLVKLSLKQTNALDVSTTVDDIPTSFVWNLTNGTGADQANIAWHDTRTVNASSSETLDLAGTLTNAFGTTVTFARVKGIFVKAASGNTNNVLLGGNGSNDFVNWVSNATDILVVRPGGCFLLAAPDATAYAVTAGTGDILKVANSSSGTSVDYTIVVWGSTS